MAKGALLRMAGAAGFAIALAGPWQFGTDLIALVAELAGVEAGPVPGPTDKAATRTPDVASTSQDLPALEPAADTAKVRWTAEVVTVAARSESHAAGIGEGWSRKAAAPRDTVGLALALQRELRRVGCYDGELHGVWAPATRRAMLAFLERANAMLPTEQPDQILLALLRGHEAKACGVACPAGQGLAADGRCLPVAILALKRPPQAMPSVASASGWSSATRIVSEPPTQPAHTSFSPPMGLAGPLTSDPAAAGSGPAQASGEPPAAPSLSSARPANPAPRTDAQPAGFGPSIFRHFGRHSF
jgi:hypothetical protein